MHDLELKVGQLIDRETALLICNGKRTSAMPSAPEMAEVMRLLNIVVFYDYVKRTDFDEDKLRSLLYDIYIKLGEQIQLALALDHNVVSVADPRRLSLRFVSQIHELRRLLFTDVQAIMHNDPAARSPHEVVSSYPAVKALLHYRAAHALLQFDVPVLPRLITELAHSATGIDIHPGAVIDEYFGIDHGTGVVIGETCIIGKHVTLYQGVTLGAKSFEYDSAGNPMNVARHPIIEDNVTIYSNTSVLGRITVGHDTVIGGNVWLTESVPPYSRVLQGLPVKNKKELITSNS